MNCPYCQRKLAPNAQFCPSCQYDFAGARQKEAHQRVIGFILIAVAAAVALFIVLLPAIIINTCRGRYKHRSGNLVMAAIRDWQTWAIGLPIAAVVLIVLNVAGAFGSSPQTNDSLSTIAADTATARHTPATPRVVVNEPPPETRRVVPPPDPTAKVVPFVAASPPPSVIADFPSPTPSTPPSPSTQTDQNSRVVVGVATGDYLNVRAAPAMNSLAVFTLANGDVVQVLGESVYNGDTEWVPVALGPQRGWVRNKYLRPYTK